VRALRFRYLAFLGAEKVPADLNFCGGLNVICGASETGKSLVVEALDYMLGGERPIRDVPERVGYDRIRLAIESVGSPPLTIERSVEGGNFKAYEELLVGESSRAAPTVLRWKHASARRDTLSHALLSRIGLDARMLRRNSSGEVRSLSFRDLARLCISNEEEIQARVSPFLSGQFVTATSEYAALKLLLTGADDNALVAQQSVVLRRDQEAGKVELLEGMIESLQEQLNQQGSEESELREQLERLEHSIKVQDESLQASQLAFDAVLKRRSASAAALREARERLSEIEELVSRFRLLDSHYATDMERLAAIRESGSMFVHLPSKACPLCGADPGDQHLDQPCDGNTEAVVRAAMAEMAKIDQLRRELGETVESLEVERQALSAEARRLENEQNLAERGIREIAAPALSADRASYQELVAQRAEVHLKLERFARLVDLVAQRLDLDGAPDGHASEESQSRTIISKDVLDQYAQTVERILDEWHYPDARRVFFDEGKRDLQIAGKDRGSSGKGLRAITHAAAKVALMEFCRERNLPHPGFIVLDSPLLAYWKPEGSEDDLSGSDLKERFYEYLAGVSSECQVIVVENEHPPRSVQSSANVIIFTKNPQQGRYGLFPVA